MEQMLTEWKRFLSENSSAVNRPKKKKKEEDPPSVKKRKQPWEVFPGYDDRNGGLKQLAHGITEDEISAPGGPSRDLIQLDDEELEEACLGNPYRKADGTWGSEKNHAVITHGYSGENSGTGCQPGKWKSGGGKAKFKCGREPSGKKHPYRCRDGQLREAIIEDDGVEYVSTEYLTELFREAIRESSQPAIEENQKSKLNQACRQAGFTTPQEAFKNLTLTLNSLHQAMKGEIGKPQK